MCADAANGGMRLMAMYLLKRLGQTIIVLIIVCVATFFMVDLVPGDPVYTVAGTSDLDQAEYDAIYYQLHLDKSTAERFFIWVKDALHGDFGMSYSYSMPVIDVIRARIPYTLFFSILTMVISVPIGVVLGIISAVKRKTWADTVITLVANTLNCLPQFWIAIVLMYFFCIKQQILPAMGFNWPWIVGAKKFFQTLFMPMVCLSLGGIAGFTRQTRSSMLEVIRQDFIRTARSKGLTESKVYFKHMMRNGLIPIITILGGRLAYIMGGSMFVETVFSIPGMGSLAMRCVQSKDIPTIQAVVIITTVISCIAYIITDILYVVVDPRISLTESKE